MKHSLLILLFLIFQTDSFGQFKLKGKPKEWKTDTVDIFSNSKEKFYTEQASYRSDNNRVGLLFTQSYDNTCCVDDEVTYNLVMTFDNWDKVELNKDYNITDLQADFEVIAFLGGEYNKPNGRIRLIKKTKRTLVFNLNMTVQSTDKLILVILKGDREFKRS